MDPKYIKKIGRILIENGIEEGKDHYGIIQFLENKIHKKRSKSKNPNELEFAIDLKIPDNKVVFYGEIIEQRYEINGEEESRWPPYYDYVEINGKVVKLGIVG